MNSLRAGRAHQDRHQHPARDGDHRHQGGEAVSGRVHEPRGRHHRRQDARPRARPERGAVPVGNAYHGQQGQLLSLDEVQSAKCKVQSAKLKSAKWEVLSRAPRKVGAVSLFTLHFALCTSVAFPQGVRDRIRNSPRATSVTESQANELTLTVTQVAVRPIQVWVRTAGLDRGGRQDAAGDDLQVRGRLRQAGPAGACVPA